MTSSSIIVIAEGWEGLWAAEQLSKNADQCEVLYIENDSLGMPICVGNGDLLEVARRTMGKALAKSYWDFSKENYKIAKKKLASITTCEERPYAYFYSNAREEELAKLSKEKGSQILKKDDLPEDFSEQFIGGLQTKCLVVNFEDLKSKLISSLKKKTSFCEPDSILEIKRQKLGEVFVRAKINKKEKEIKGDALVIVSNSLCGKLIPPLKEILIPITLSSFSFEQGEGFPDCGMAVFNNGADFIFLEEGTVRAGSFRNLFQDKAVGVQEQADAITLKGVQGFFGQLGWIDEAPQKTFLSVESLSCDGLPVASSVQGTPEIFVVSGFGAKTSNTFFGIIENLVSGIFGKKGPNLDLFSLKRMV